MTAAPDPRPATGPSPRPGALPADLRAEALRRLAGIPALGLVPAPTPVHELAGLRRALGGGPRLVVKRDDVIPFGFGGNKVRKIDLVAREAQAGGADVLVTVGGVQSNHARVTAATAATIGLGAVLVVSGPPTSRPAGNAVLEELLGAEIVRVDSRDEREPALREVVGRLERAGHRPYVIPLGGSTPLGALGLARAVGELLGQIDPPDVIIQAASCGGTLAGIAVGCALHGLATRVIGISADDTEAVLLAQVRHLIEGMSRHLGCGGATLAAACRIEADAGFIGEGYGAPTPESHEAQRLAARTEAMFVDHTYTGKALAGLVAYVRAGRFPADHRVLFWHTGGQVGLFA